MIINNVICNLGIETKSSSKHSGINVLEEMIKTWKLKYQWPDEDEEDTNEMTLICNLCSYLKTQLKLTNVFGYRS